MLVHPFLIVKVFLNITLYITCYRTIQKKDKLFLSKHFFLLLLFQNTLKEGGCNVKVETITS